MFLLLIIFPLTLILLLLWSLTGKRVFGRVLGYLWLSLLGLIILGIIINQITSQKELKRKHYYGDYVINRNLFKGKQTDWQYNHFRFTITESDSIYFYVTENEKIIKTYRGKIKTTKPHLYPSERLIIIMDQPSHHILADNPTTYRSAWNFYLVFNSTKFKNVYFKKGTWKPIVNSY